MFFSAIFFLLIIAIICSKLKKLLIFYHKNIQTKKEGRVKIQRKSFRGGIEDRFLLLVNEKRMKE